MLTVFSFDPFASRSLPYGNLIQRNVYYYCTLHNSRCGSTDAVARLMSASSNFVFYVVYAGGFLIHDKRSGCASKTNHNPAQRTALYQIADSLLSYCCVC